MVHLVRMKRSRPLCMHSSVCETIVRVCQAVYIDFVIYLFVCCNLPPKGRQLRAHSDILLSMKELEKVLV